MPANLKQHLQNQHSVEFADVVRSEEQKKQSSIKDFTHCSPGSPVLQYPKGKACELLKKIAEMITLDTLPYSTLQGLLTACEVDIKEAGCGSSVYPLKLEGAKKPYNKTVLIIDPQKG